MSAGSVLVTVKFTVSPSLTVVALGVQTKGFTIGGTGPGAAGPGPGAAGPGGAGVGLTVIEILSVSVLAPEASGLVAINSYSMVASPPPAGNGISGGITKLNVPSSGIEEYPIKGFLNPVADNEANLASVVSQVMFTTCPTESFVGFASNLSIVGVFVFNTGGTPLNPPAPKGLLTVRIKSFVTV